MRRVEQLKQQGVMVLPSLFTLANLALGFFAILAASDRQFGRAGWMILGGDADGFSRWKGGPFGPR